MPKGGYRKSQEVNRFMLGLFSGVAGGLIVGWLIKAQIEAEVAKMTDVLMKSPFGRLLQPSGTSGVSGMGDILSPEGHWKQWSADRVPRETERLL